MGDMAVAYVEQIGAEPRLNIGGVIRRTAAERSVNRTKLSPWELLTGVPFLLSADCFSPPFSLV